MKKLLICIPLLMYSFLQGQQIEWHAGEVQKKIFNEIKIYEDKEGTLKINTVASPAFKSQFEKSTIGIEDFQHSDAVFWIRLTLTNTPGEALMLELAQPLVPEAILYYADSSGNWHSLKAGWKTNLYKKPIPHPYQLFSLPPGIHRFYVQLKSSANPVPITLWNLDRYQEKIRNQKIVFGVYMGIMLFVILYNLFIFFSLRRAAYLHYSLLVFLYAFFAAMYDGYFCYLFPDADLLWWYLLNPIVNQPNGMLFALFFLQVHKYSRRFFIAGLALFIYFTSFIFWYRFLDLPLANNITQANALIGILFMSVLGIIVGKGRNKLGYYFAGAYLVFFVIASIEVLHLQTGKPDHIFDLSYVSIAIFTEVLFLLFLLSKRFSWEKQEVEREKTLAQSELLAQTIENERIVREQNLILEKRVTERTAEVVKEKEIAQEERKHSDELLLNILPVDTAEELKRTGAAEARDFEKVTILFTDFKNFTLASEQLNARELVNEINFYYSRFDEIISKHGIEKIKTIGDSYMCAGGLSGNPEDSVKKTVLAALDIRDFILAELALRKAESRKFFEIRIGLNTGSVIAGVVGIKKFAYDIWGEAVNIASRMESGGEAGQVNISESTYYLIKNDPDFICTPRGKLKVKNKGEFEMYFVTRIGNII